MHVVNNEKVFSGEGQNCTTDFKQPPPHHAVYSYE
jgi:hypothetical protein